MNKPKIQPEKFYSATDVVNLGIMSASNKHTQRQMLLRHIRNGRIKAANVGTEEMPRYVVQGKELSRYAESRIKPGSYRTKAK